MQPASQIAENFFVLVVILATIAQAQQYSCSCSCCVGYNCQPVTLNNIYATSCSLNSCLLACRTQYSYQCRVPPYGQVNAQCVSGSTSPYNCRCDCCNFGSPNCTPALVGYTSAYLCQPSSCSIACAAQYPGVCISNQFGQTQGTCLGLVTTTTTTTTIAPWLGNACSCFCCQSSPYCLPIYNVGNTSAAQCSTSACTLACQAQYPTLCPYSSILGQTNGLCLNTASGSTRCRCSCCSAGGCRDYNVYTNGGCTSCSSMCQAQTQCVNPYTITQSCYNKATTLTRFSFYRLELVYILALISFFSICWDRHLP